VAASADGRLAFVPIYGSTGLGAAATADGKWFLVAVPSKDLVAVVDLASKQVVRSVAVVKSPREILIRPDGKVAYVSCPRSGQVAAVDLNAWKVEKLIGVGKAADGLGWAK
jgi:DNA-binding beta-propeller fold protein YncE